MAPVTDKMDDIAQKNKMDDGDDELRIGGKSVATESTGCCGYNCLGVAIFWQSVVKTPVLIATDKGRARVCLGI